MTGVTDIQIVAGTQRWICNTSYCIHFFGKLLRFQYPERAL